MSALRFKGATIEDGTNRAFPLIRTIRTAGCMGIRDAQDCVARGEFRSNDEDLVVNVYEHLVAIGEEVEVVS